MLVDLECIVIWETLSLGNKSASVIFYCVNKVRDFSILSSSVLGIEEKEIIICILFIQTETKDDKNMESAFDGRGILSLVSATIISWERKFVLIFALCIKRLREQSVIGWNS